MFLISSLWFQIQLVPLHHDGVDAVTGWRIVIRDVLSRKSVVDAMRGGEDRITVTLTPGNTAAPTPADAEALEAAETQAAIVQDELVKVQDAFGGGGQRRMLLGQQLDSANDDDIADDAFSGRRRMLEEERREKLRGALADAGFVLPRSVSSSSSTSSSERVVDGIDDRPNLHGGGGGAAAVALGDAAANSMATGILNSLMSGSMTDTQLEALLRMLQNAGMLPTPPAIEPKSWSLVGLATLFTTLFYSKTMTEKSRECDFFDDSQFNNQSCDTRE